MKLQGGRRTSPASNAEIRAKHRCPQCNFSATTKSVLDSHVNNTHGMLPTCPFCNIGFQNLGALKRHIENAHKEKEVRPGVITQNAPINPIVSQKLCIFYLQPRGCKKGQNCDFSHDSNNQQFEFVKVRKACFNGINCSWKPRCRYVHFEDGEVLPARAPREGGMRSQASNQDFGNQDLSRPPPGFRSNISSMLEFPSLPQVSRPSVFRQNPNCQ